MLFADDVDGYHEVAMYLPLQAQNLFRFQFCKMNDLATKEHNLVKPSLCHEDS